MINGPETICRWKNWKRRRPPRKDLGNPRKRNKVRWYNWENKIRLKD
jgi:hypothetical protein